MTLSRVTVFLFTLSGSITFAQHFRGFPRISEQKIKLTRKIPASVDMTGKAIKLDVTYKGTNDSEFHSLLDSKLLTLLTGREGKGVRLVKSEQDGTLNAQILSMETKTDRGKPKNGGGFTFQSLAYAGKCELTVELTDGKGNPLEAKSDEFHFARSGFMTTRTMMGMTVPLTNAELSPHDLKGILADGVAHKIARLVVNLDDTFEAPLPGNHAFENANKALAAAKWGEGIEDAEKASVDDKDQPFKEYLVGLGNEGLAYAEHDHEKIVDSLNRAEQHYANALEKKPDYKEAITADGRVKDSLEYYMTIQAVKKGAEVSKSSATPLPAVSSSKDDSPKAPTTVTPLPEPASASYKDGENSALVFLKKSGAKDELLINYIAATPNPHYDLSAAGLGVLLQAGVSQAVIDAVQKKMAPPPAPKPNAPPARKPKPTA